MQEQRFLILVKLRELIACLKQRASIITPREVGEYADF